MKTYLLQPLKLQFISTYKYYLINYLVASVLIILSIALKIFNLLTVLLVIEFLFTLTMGLLDNMVCANTYYSLKHDRKPFILSSLIINIANSAIITILFIVASLLLYVNKATNLIALKGAITVLLLMFTAFSLGTTYSAFLSEKKFINIIAVMIILALTIILGYNILHSIEKLLQAIFNVIVTDVNMYYSEILNIYLLFSVLISICLNILNSIKYLYKK